MLEIVVRNSSSPSGSTLKPSVSTTVVKEVDIVDDAGRTKKLKTIKTVVVKQKKVSQSTLKEQRVSTTNDAVTVTSTSTNTATISSAATNADSVTNVTSISGSSSETSKSVAALVVTENVVQQSLPQESATPSDSCPSTEAFDDSLENANVCKDTTESVQCLVRDKQGNIITFDGGPDQIPADCTLVQVVKVKKVTSTKVVKMSSTVTHGSKTMVVASSSQPAAPSSSAAITDSLSPKSEDAPGYVSQHFVVDGLDCGQRRRRVLRLLECGSVRGSIDSLLVQQSLTFAYEQDTGGCLHTPVQRYVRLLPFSFNYSLQHP